MNWGRNQANCAHNWWNTPRCDCPPDGLELYSRGIGTYGGPLGALPLTSPATVEVTRQFESRYINWSFGANNDVIHGREPHYWQTATLRNPKNAVTTVSSFARSKPQVGTVTNLAFDGDPIARTLVTKVATKYHWGLKGLTGSALIGGVLSGFGRWVEDVVSAPCLTGGERITRALTDALYGLGISVGAGLSAMALAGLGAAPIVATLGGLGVSIALSESVSYARNRDWLP